MFLLEPQTLLALPRPMMALVNAASIEEVARRHGMRLLLEFGSSVTGRLHAHSDRDLAVLLEYHPASLAAHADLIADLQALFPGREIDLAILNRADPPVAAACPASLFPESV